ncbi:MAG: type III-B CRISPR module-associated Cmr3 family protein [Flavobacteriales bacterium]|nr:type III-B CRISPR module-associated Cmr3 family protein [Flavobacteriales bacterium]
MSSGTKTIRFILKPLDTIFFGDEKSFFKQAYHQHSRMLPQQTGVLGFLRYEALRRADLLGKNHALWTSLIGSKSFDGSSQSFGVIKSISALSIYTDTVDLFPLRNSCELPEKPVAVTTNFGDGSAQWQSLALFEDAASNRYDPKKTEHFALCFSDYLGNTFDAECKGADHHIEAHGFDKPDWTKSGIFWKDARPGITKSYAGIPNDAGFFHTEFWRMNPEFAFSFVAKIEESDKLKFYAWEEPAVVRFGGDRSLYKMSIDLHNSSRPATKRTGNVFVLLSDALVSNSIYDHCTSAVSETQHFRSVRTESKAGEKWNKRPTEWKGSKQGIASPAKTLIKHGSILIAKDDDAAIEIEEALKKEKAYCNIGYNQFQRLEKLPKGKSK